MNDDVFKREESVKVLEKMLCDMHEEIDAVKGYTETVHEVLNNVYSTPVRAKVLQRLEHIIADEMEHLMLLGQNYTEMTNIAVEVNSDVSTKSIQPVPLQ